MSSPIKPVDVNVFDNIVNNGAVDVEKFICLLWERRDKHEEINILTESMCIFIEDKQTFQTLEFYFPQLIHMILQLNWDSKTLLSLKRLVATICSISAHAALQLHFIVFAASQDYQPELVNEKANPDANERAYLKCTNLLQLIENATVFGRGLPHMDSNGLSSPQSPPSTSFRTGDLHTENKQRIERILMVETEVEKGKLNFKRAVSKGVFYSWKWKPRHFVIRDRTLFCYHDENSSTILRAIPLFYSSIIAPTGDDVDLDLCFDVYCEVTGAIFHLKADSKESKKKWVSIIHRETGAAEHEEFPLELHFVSERLNFPDMSSPASTRSNIESLTRMDKVKFLFFEQEKKFVHSLTDIAERLRPRSPNLRKLYLQKYLRRLVIPPLAYVPFKESAGEYACILNTLPSECHAFNTKARCPSLILFECEKHPGGIDMATFFNVDLRLYSPEDVKSALRIGVLEDDLDHEAKNSSATALSPQNSFNSNFLLHNTSCSTIWQPVEFLIERYSREKIQIKNASSNNKLNSNNRAAYTPTKENSSSAPSVTSTNDIALHDINISDLSSSEPSANSTSSRAASTVVKAPLLGETRADKEARLLASSEHGGLRDHWALDGLISKSNDDVRQEVFVIQLIAVIQKIFARSKCSARLYTYKILNTSKSTGIIQLIPDSISLDGLKKSSGYPGSLKEYFYKTYGRKDINPDDVSITNSPALKHAISCFVRSLAGYSVVAYLLDIKDRHNGNIMIDKEGHIIHIDFGFVFGLAPGKAFSMEKSPFKLTKEYVDLMGGLESTFIALFRDYCVEALIAVRQNYVLIESLFSIMSFGSNYPAFRYNKNAIRDFHARLHLQDALKEKDVETLMNQLIKSSCDNAGTNFYDNFQVWTNGIAK